MSTSGLQFAVFTLVNVIEKTHDSNVTLAMPIVLLTTSDLIPVCNAEFGDSPNPGLIPFVLDIPWSGTFENRYVFLCEQLRVLNCSTS